MWTKSKESIFYILNNVKVIKIIRKDLWVGIIVSGKKFSHIETITSENLEVLKVQSLLKAKEMGWDVKSLYSK